MAIIGNKETLGDDRLTRIAKADPKPWYQKPNLRFAYLILIPCGLGVEWTSGFDSSMMNSLQAVESWERCKSHIPLFRTLNSWFSFVAVSFILTLRAARLRLSQLFPPRSPQRHV